MSEALGSSLEGLGTTSSEDTPYARIKAMILANRIPPDTKLTIDRLARELGVSQTPIREALQRLEGDKLVVSKKPRGLWTTPLLNEQELTDLIEVRLLLEPWAVRAVSIDRAANPGREMLRQVELFLAESESRTAGYALASHDVVFHDLIFRAAGNPLLHETYKQLHAHLHLFRLYPADLDGTHTVEEHRRIAEAIADADADRAEQAIRDHLFAAMGRFSTGFYHGAAPQQRLNGVASAVLASPHQTTDL